MGSWRLFINFKNVSEEHLCFREASLPLRYLFFALLIIHPPIVLRLIHVHHVLMITDPEFLLRCGLLRNSPKSFFIIQLLGEKNRVPFTVFELALGETGSCSETGKGIVSEVTVVLHSSRSTAETLNWKWCFKVARVSVSVVQGVSVSWADASHNN